jgi:hypothetical protein
VCAAHCQWETVVKGAGVGQAMDVERVGGTQLRY